ncbi:MAG: tRNA 2-thiouridine(34) synthase MnmA [Chlamydiia bacterium]|nr:tRNA 2-thiouridine(34) synthase MnmA [Chlamydiia bacterium]
MKIVVGMSGGVDSAVTAHLLKEQGHDVLALFMRNWEEDGEACTAQEDYEDVVSVCEQIDIPYYAVNFAKEYRERVFAYLLEECQAGRTPNPDILCNSEIKFDLLLAKAKELGGECLATGHYCQLDKSGEIALLRGADPNKDQSYFLHALTQDQLRDVLFPIGHFPKEEVRRIAQEKGLINAKKRDSTGICFIGKRNFRDFLSQYLPFQPGPLLSYDGQKLGEHSGIAFFTIGQRKGIGIGGAGDAWYVVDKDPKQKAVILAQGANHPALFKASLKAYLPTWIGTPPSLPYRCTAKIRYRQSDEPCTITTEGESLVITFDKPQRAVTPGQAIVFYQGEQCLGGATIL